MSAEIKIQFLGAAQEVTGSCYLIKVGRKTLLLDCGLIQGTPEDEARNKHSFPFDVSSIDAVVLSHAHIDHSGRLPLLAKAGYSGPIYTHPACRDLCAIMLVDSGYLNEKEVEWDNRKRQRKHLPLLEPLYDVEDAKAVMEQFQAINYGERREILPGVEVRLNDAGHILGSSIVELWLQHNGVHRKLVSSGDLGHRGVPILRSSKIIEHADFVLLESTYGDRAHRSWDETWEELRDILNNAHHRRGNILIPSFAVGRTQELLYSFHRNYDEWDMKRWNIFLDSPMAIEATEVYNKHPELYNKETLEFLHQQGNPFKPPNFHFSRTAADSMSLNQIESGAIIIAGSGMCSGGRIKHHLKHQIWRRDCHLVIVGFQARGTLGRQIVDGARQINLWGESIAVGAHVHTVGGFSAHADCNGLSQWYGHFKNRPPVALVHGEQDAMASLEQRLLNEGAQAVHRPAFKDRYDLVKLKKV